MKIIIALFVFVTLATATVPIQKDVPFPMCGPCDGTGGN